MRMMKNSRTIPFIWDLVVAGMKLITASGLEINMETVSFNRDNMVMLAETASATGLLPYNRLGMRFGMKELTDLGLRISVPEGYDLEVTRDTYSIVYGNRTPRRARRSLNSLGIYEAIDTVRMGDNPICDRRTVVFSDGFIHTEVPYWFNLDLDELNKNTILSYVIHKS